MLGWLILFVITLIFFGAIGFIWLKVGDARRKEKLVRSLSSKLDPSGTVRTTVLVEQPGRANRLKSFFTPHTAQGVNVAERFNKGTLLLLTLLSAGLGFMLGLKFTGILGIFAPVIGAIAATYLVRLYRSQRRDKRLAAIEEQFPEALDFLGRSVRAGNAFSIALELLAEESSEPLKSEVRKLTREMALGSGLEDALYGLVARIPLLEVRMFVAAVLMQRETGGNLSEVLTKLATSVRERLRLRGHVKAVSGQGRLTARVLTFLPLATILMLKVVAPVYINGMLNDPVGRNLLGIAVLSQMTGYYVMQKIIRIEV
jgi:tight adherence protein B